MKLEKLGFNYNDLTDNQYALMLLDILLTKNKELKVQIYSLT